MFARFQIVYDLTNIKNDEIFGGTLQVAIWQANSTLVRDNFALCESNIKLATLQNFPAKKDGVYELHDWFRVFYASPTS